MKVSELLREAKKLIDQPEKWTKGAFHAGQAHCAIGALQLMGSRPTPRLLVFSLEFYQALSFLNKATPLGKSPVVFNDLPSTTHADIMKLYDDAVAAAEKAEASETPPSSP